MLYRAGVGCAGVYLPLVYLLCTTTNIILIHTVHHYQLLNQDNHNITLLEKQVVVNAFTVAQQAPIKTPCVLAPVDAFTNASCTAQFPGAYVFVTGLMPLTQGLVGGNASKAG